MVVNLVRIPYIWAIVRTFYLLSEPKISDNRRSNMTEEKKESEKTAVEKKEETKSGKKYDGGTIPKSSSSK